MTMIAILPESAGPTTTFRAVAGRVESTGRTPGEALDALTAQLDASETGTLVVVQQQRPDRYFSAAQQLRLAELMQRWRAARDTGGPWSAAEQAELDALIAAELQAATDRAAALARQLSP
jgi:hypothetical protein